MKTKYIRYSRIIKHFLLFIFPVSHWLEVQHYYRMKKFATEEQISIALQNSIDRTDKSHYNSFMTWSKESLACNLVEHHRLMKWAIKRIEELENSNKINL